MQGIDDRGECLTANRVAIRKRSKRETHLIVDLAEGRNREIRRMFRSLGREVTRLKRIRFAEIELGDLAPGEWRYLTPDQLPDGMPDTYKSRHTDFRTRRSRSISG